jgi:erythromycin esterase
MLAVASVSNAVAPAPADGLGFATWARRAQVTDSDFAALGQTIGTHRVVVLTEGAHAAAEPLEARNQLFKYLVERQGFTAIAIESGIVESRLVHQYVRGAAGELNEVLAQGVTWSFDQLPQNRELVAWLRDYNADPRHARKVNFYGFDVPGSPGNPDANRDMATALNEALAFVTRVDPAAGALLRSRLGSLDQYIRFGFSRSPETPGYDRLSQTQRDLITSLGADLLTLLERHEAQYVAGSSRSDYDWAYRAAIGAREADQWLRQIPLDWAPLAPGEPVALFSEQLKFMAAALDVRDRAQADNLGWILEREGPQGKILVFAHLYHLSAAPMTTFWRSGTGVTRRSQAVAGTYLKARLGDQLISIGNLIGRGEVACAGFRERLAAAQPGSWEQSAGEVGSPRYWLDLRQAPAPILQWLHQTRPVGHGGDSFEVSLGAAFDVLFFIDSVTPACP